MNSWSNIEISDQDPEIIQIDKLEHSLGNISPNYRKIRELITRFEVCHFKYKRHIKNIKDSIRSLKPKIEPKEIGLNHISKGENAWKKDRTGRSLKGQQYLYGLLNWLAYKPKGRQPDTFNERTGQQIAGWLGDKNPDKERLVRLLIARLTWDWKSYNEYHKEEKYKELEYQICRMDICHYAFPKHIDRLLKGIGKMRPIDKFEGCGTINNEIKIFIEKEYSELCELLISIVKNYKVPAKNDKIRLWLVASFAKTLKEHIGSDKPLPELTGLIND